MSVGRLFHTRGPATANARSPNLLRVRGTYRSPLSAVRNEARGINKLVSIGEVFRRTPLLLLQNVHSPAAGKS